MCGLVSRKSTPASIKGAFVEILMALFYKIFRIGPQNLQWPDRDMLRRLRGG